jgi:hypothetical protein
MAYRRNNVQIFLRSPVRAEWFGKRETTAQTNDPALDNCTAAVIHRPGVLSHLDARQIACHKQR